MPERRFPDDYGEFSARADAVRSVFVVGKVAVRGIPPTCVQRHILGDLGRVRVHFARARLVVIPARKDFIAFVGKIGKRNCSALITDASISFAVLRQRDAITRLPPTNAEIRTLFIFFFILHSPQRLFL